MAGRGGLALAVIACALSACSAKPDSTTRAAGDLGSVTFAVKRGDEVLPGTEGMRVRAHDEVTFTATAAVPQHVVVARRDAAGKVSVLVGEHTALPVAGTAVVMGEPARLDGQLGPELVWAVFCFDRFGSDMVVQELLARRAPPDWRRCHIQQLHWTKEPTPVPARRPLP